MSQSSVPSRSVYNKKTPIKNIKKKMDRKNEAKAWANTVTEALSDCIDKKQWLQALEVMCVYMFVCFVHTIMCWNM